MLYDTIICRPITYIHIKGHKDQFFLTVLRKGKNTCVIISQYNSIVSVTNSIEQIATHIVNTLSEEIAGIHENKHDLNFVFIEHYPNDESERPAGGDFATVNFLCTNQPQYEIHPIAPPVALHSPRWQHISKQDLENQLQINLNTIHKIFTPA